MVGLRFGDRMKCYVIAEAGVNHNGSVELALKLVETAAEQGASAVKFQTFRAESLVAKGTETAEYQQQRTSCTDQYAMLKKLELSEQSHEKIMSHCKMFDIEFLSTPFDLGSAQFLLGLGMERIKIPSGELTNLPFIAALSELNKPMILSTGMAFMGEVQDAVTTIQQTREQQGFVDPLEAILTLLHCTSNYPARAEDVNLNAMLTMAAELKLPVGYSDHTEGTLVSVAAVAMGAQVIEKHFTLNRNMPGPDHKASLEPKELGEMIRHIRQIEACMGDGVKVPRASELPTRELVRRSVTLATDKAAGEVIREEDLLLLRPGTGIPPKQFYDIVGRRLRSAQIANTQLSWHDLTDA